MLKLSIWELIFRTIPEGFIFLLASYAFARKKIENNRYILASILLGIAGYLIRMLPIHFGVHTILLIMVNVLIVTSINKIAVKKVISAVLSSTIIMFISEGLNVVILDKLFNIKITDVANKVSMKLLYSSPSLILTAVVILVLYWLLNRNKRR